MHRCSDCSGLSRRRFLAAGAGSFLAWVLARKPAWAAPAGVAPRNPARRAILLWLDGGPSQFETFDPKPGRATGGPTGAVDSAIRGVQLAEHLPRLAQRLDRLALIRTMKTPEGAHERARYLMHTGYAPNPTVDYPSAGSIVARELPREESDLPPYVCIGGNVPAGEGFFSARLAPFLLRDPTAGVPNVAPPSPIGPDRTRRRREILRQMENRFRSGRDPVLAQKRAEMYEAAQALIDSERLRAFHIGEEPQERREEYGMNPFGQGCLLARRLVEAGVPFVEVQLGGWDTHQDNFTRTPELARTLDQGFAALLDDLDRTGLFDETLVICMGEFGRTPRINANEGRDHFARAWSVLLGGGPIERGAVIGRTNEDGSDVAERPVSAGELFATIFHALGIDYTKQFYAPNGRPIRIADSDHHIRELVS